MKRFSIILHTAVAAVAVTTAVHGSSLPGPTWKESEAVVAIESVDTARELRTLHELARMSDSDALLQRLAETGERSEWPAPAREFVLFSFARSLSDLPPGAVDARVLDLLAATRPEVRLAHPDDDRLGIPMFNIPAATAGARTEWRRQRASRQASERLARGADDWIDGFLAAGRAEREGFLDRLESADRRQVEDLAVVIDSRLENEYALAAAGAWAGILLHDADLYAHALSGRPPPGLAELARRATAAFDAALALRALSRLAAAAPDATTAVMVAEWAPTLLRSDEGTERLFELLDDDGLGLAAALAIARHGDSSARSRLATIASGEQVTPARHAAIALSGTVGRRDPR